ncbi:filamentation induced by cAMP protein fic [Bacillus toyonensis]|uniref:filamentation induced by cAMP protein fic n=1 Tax=Bacillus toyonensis TaxID=155322 RepID=UPI0020D26CE6|nr:filamentation induced by cAMP protein fic [Bacillus toyonensis]
MKDKYNLNRRESFFLLKKTMVELIHSTSKLENVKTTFPQTQTLVGGMSVSGVSTDDILVILNLKHAYQYIISLVDSDKDLEKLNNSEILPVACMINSYVSYNESLEWGVLRKGSVGIHGVNYIPTIPKEEDVLNDIETIMTLNESMTYRILKYTYYAMRSQLFWDGNKRTAILTANTMLTLNGLGVLNIKEQDLEQWHELLTEFYETNNDSKIIEWTYTNCIYGIDYN